MKEWSLSADAREIRDSDGRRVCRFPTQFEGGLEDADRLRAIATMLTSSMMHEALARMFRCGSWHDDGTWVYEPVEGTNGTNAIDELFRLSGS
jgi:hypothetical protein